MQQHEGRGPVNLSLWAIRNPVPVLMLFVLLTAAGLLSFVRLSVQNFPDMDIPTVSVSLELPGASPAQLEHDVARRIEDALASVQGIRHIDTVLTDGLVAITVEFRTEKPTQEAVDDVRDAVSRVRADLPADVRDPVIQRLDLAGGPMVGYAVSSATLDEQALSWWVDDTARRALLAVPGVGAVQRIGGLDREVRVELKPERLLARRTTAVEVSRALGQTQLEASGGRLSVGDAEQSIRVSASVATAQELSRMEITLADGRRLRLADVATVVDASAEQRSRAFLGDMPVVGINIVRARGYGEVEVAAGVAKAIAKLREDHPTIQLRETLNLVHAVTENYEGSLRLLYEGAALAVLVVFAFLRDARATLVAAIALPLSIVPTFAAMLALGFTLNTITLLALSLVVGVVVDDAIVEVENIERHLLDGKEPMEASMDAASEIGLAVVATTLTLVAVFLPTAFMSGMAGKYFWQFGWTAAIAVLFSLAVARLLTPLLAAWLLRPHPAPPRSAWVDRYVHLVRWCLSHRAWVVAGMVIVLAVTLAGATRLPTAFVPADDDDQTQVSLTLPPGASLDTTQRGAEEARRLLSDIPEVRQVFSALGASTAGEEVNRATLTVQFTPRADRHGITKRRLEQAVRDRLAALPGIRVSVGMGDGGDSFVLVLTGDPVDALDAHARSIVSQLRTLPGVGSVTASTALVRPEVAIRPDYVRAADLGVSSSAVADAVRIATTGDYSPNLPKFNVDDRQIRVNVRLASDARTDVEVLKRLQVPGLRGAVELQRLAMVGMTSGPMEVTRRDRTRNINIVVELHGNALGDVERAVLALPAVRALPLGIQATTTGDAEEMGELLIGFGIAMGMGVLCVYMILVLLLKDFVQPFTILTALVLGIPGAVLTLALTGGALSMPSMIGMVMLLGITTKNAILLTDYIVLARRSGQSRRAAILDACHKRARPIVMTTVAMVGGMIPVALGLDGDPSFRSPMALVVIGGLVGSTMLSLVVVPVAYSLLDDGERWLRSSRHMSRSLARWRP